MRSMWCLAVFALCPLAPALRAQAIPLGTPAPVLRRIAQAVWPENLFDSAGRPESGFVRRGNRPQFTDLKIARLPMPPERFTGVVFYAGSAYPSGCVHCGERRAAVAQRDSVFVSLLEAGDIAQVLPWAAPAFGMADSVALRQAVVDLLEASCLLGCGVRRVRERRDLPTTPFLSPADPSAKRWTMPRTYSHVSSASLSVEFPVLTPDGLFQVQAERDWRGNFHVLVIAVAYPLVGG